MKRRDFGLLAGTSLATAATLRTANAQTAAPDPSLLDTTLTPMGAERAGNADGSIPAWTGGLVSAPPSPDQPVAVRLFEDEAPLYEVNAGNMAQYADLLSEGTKFQITNYGYRLKVFPTHRTAAAPQYVYDNAAKNVTRAQLDPRGGRLGFTGAVGGPPFPIINTADPLVGGAQLIWNHLTAWVGYSDLTLFAPGTVVVNGRVLLVAGQLARTVYPYYAPDVTPENYDGYYSKGHYYYKAPSSVVGQEQLVWHSTNVNVHPDIVWELLNGQGRVRKAPDEQYDTPSPAANGIANIDENSCFYGNPSEFDWTLITKKEMLVPYNCNKMLFSNVTELLKPHFPDPEIVRWEKHRVWVVEATVHPGEHNVVPKRRLYIDEDSWFALLGEGYDADGTLVKAYAIYNECEPSMPGTVEQATTVYNLTTGDYCFNGNDNYESYSGAQFLGPQPDSDFEPQEMAANASF
jgi:hypothetical protein